MEQWSSRSGEEVGMSARRWSEPCETAPVATWDVWTRIQTVLVDLRHPGEVGEIKSVAKWGLSTRDRDRSGRAPGIRVRSGR
jgi:hypothetical protein